MPFAYSRGYKNAYNRTAFVDKRNLGWRVCHELGCRCHDEKTIGLKECSWKRCFIDNEGFKLYVAGETMKPDNGYHW